MCNCMEQRNPFAHIAAKIPESEQAAVIEAVNRTYRLTPDWQDIETLFRVWNTYITPEEPQDMGCRGCRTRVIGRLRNVVQIWENGN